MQPAFQEDTRRIFTVSQVTKDLRQLLEDNFPSLWISGEVSNFKAAASGHFYFTLKDENAQLGAVMFKGHNQLLKFQLENGLEIIVHGHITVYEPRGQYQIIIDYVEPKGLGALQLAFEQLKKRLEAEGLFDKKYKKPIPYLPKKVGIITSPKGAVLHDIQTILTRRFPNIEILINPVRVQGDGAAEEIAEAVDEMNRRSDVDVLIVGRGGGSLEDLWAFNEEIVVRSIFNSKIPVISAVGHETDYTLSDLAADLRAPTPSAAAELAVPGKEDLTALIDEHRSGLKYAIGRHLSAIRDKVMFIKKQFKDPKKILEDFKLLIDDLSCRLVDAEKQLIKDRQHDYREVFLRLKALSPLDLLKRGYSIVFKKGDLKPVKSAEEVKKEERLDIRLYDGQLKVKVVS